MATFTEIYEAEKKQSDDEILSLKNDNKILKSALYKIVKRIDAGDIDELTLHTLSELSIAALKAIK